MIENRLEPGKISRTDRLIAVGQRRAGQIVKEWTDLGNKFVFYALARACVEPDKRLAQMGVAHPNFKFEALFRKALAIDPERTLDVLSGMQGDQEILARYKTLALEAVRELELQNKRGEMRGWVREALGSLSSFVSFAD